MKNTLIKAEGNTDERNGSGSGASSLLMVSEDGVKKMAMEHGGAGDYRTKFREILWTSDRNKEMPIMVVPDKLGQERL